MPGKNPRRQYIYPGVDVESRNPENSNLVASEPVDAERVPWMCASRMVPFPANSSALLLSYDEDKSSVFILHNFVARSSVPKRTINSLANCLRLRFDELGRPSDLHEAIAFHRDALQLLPHEHPFRSSSLSNLANCLHARFEQLGRLSDLDEALAFYRDALQLRPQGHPGRPLSLVFVANCLYTRFKCSGENDPSVLQEMFDLFSLLSDHSCALSPVDLGRRGIGMWIQAAEHCKHSTTVLAYQTSLRLCVQHLATVPGVPQQLGLLKTLVASTPVDAFSACLRHNNTATAVELLEQGRGVFWTQLTRFRSPVDELIGSGDRGQQLGTELKRTATMLRNLLGHSPSVVDSQHDRVCYLGIQMQDVIAEIHKLPGFSRFLQPPLFSDLRIAAAEGPVIIVNASQYTCDALIITSGRQPIRVTLSITKARVSELSEDLRSLTLLAITENVTRDLVILLRELWDSVVSLIVEILQDYCPPQSRVWWCPTAEFSLLPLHAAGPYRRGQQNFSDYYISSYTPTLAALIRARQQSSSKHRTEKSRFLLVGQDQAPGQDTLVSVNSELSSISQCVGLAAALTCIQGQEANITKVSEELNKHEFVHLACHGILNREQPFESGFALADGLLKIERIMRYDIQDGQFAYLSACHTTVGDEESPDEVIHLAAAMQFAGFRSVIGTMWAVDDAYTEAITSKFYECMLDEDGRLDHTRAALALHKTTQSVPDIPFDQRILYIHIGA